MRRVGAICLLLAIIPQAAADPAPGGHAPAPGKPAIPRTGPLAPSSHVIAQALAERWSKCTVAASERYDRLAASVGDTINASFGACKNGEFALRFFLLAEGLAAPAADAVMERLRTNVRETLSSRLLGRRGEPSAPPPRVVPPADRSREAGDRV